MRCKLGPKDETVLSKSFNSLTTEALLYNVQVFSLLSEIRALWTVRILTCPQSPDDIYKNQRLYLGRGVCDCGGNPDVGNLDDGWDGT